MGGVEMILVAGHDPAWAQSSEDETRRLRVALGETAVRIHHIGSTAIPQIKAKPVIDILLEAASLDSLDEKGPLLEALGYEAMGEFGIPGRRYFRKDDSTGRRTHHIHAFEPEVPNVIRHIAFRDYMRSQPVIAVEYGELKERLAREHPNDMTAYMDGKDAFIKEHERRALLWLRS